MKKILMMALIALAAGTTAFAAPNIANTKAFKHFSNAFKSATDVSWNADEQFNKVSFVLNEEKVAAFYDTDGDLIGTSKNIAFDKLPKAAIEVITTKYTFPENQLKECIEFTNSGNQRNYYVSFDRKYETLILEITKSGAVSVFARNKK